MMKQLILAAMVLLVGLCSGCAFPQMPPVDNTSAASATSSATQSQTPNARVTDLNNNLLLYERAGGKTYTADELKRIYLPYSIQRLMSRTVSVEEVNDRLPLRFDRSNGDRYYTYYRANAGTLYLFFDVSGEGCTFLYLTNTKLTAAAFETLKADSSTFEDVAAIDPGALLYDKVPALLDRETPAVTEPRSEHVLENGDLLVIRYKSVDGKAVVQSMDTEKDVATPYTDLLLNIDKK